MIKIDYAPIFDILYLEFPGPPRQGHVRSHGWDPRVFGILVTDLDEENRLRSMEIHGATAKLPLALLAEARLIQDVREEGMTPNAFRRGMLGSKGSVRPGGRAPFPSFTSTSPATPL